MRNLANAAFQKIKAHKITMLFASLVPKWCPNFSWRYKTIRENIILYTMKPAEDGSEDIILRLYESKKAAVTARIHTAFEGYTPYVCDMLEHILEEALSLIHI